MALVGEITDIPNDGMTIDGELAPDDKLAYSALPPSKLPPLNQFKILKSWVLADIDHSSNWRKWMKEWFAFRAGKQWTKEDEEILREQQRPVIVFNRVLTILKAVAGMEINGRHEVAFIPRETADTAPSEIVAATSRYMSDNCDAEDEESMAFDHTATCGMGWVEERMAYLDEPKGKYVEENIHPEEMVWDRRARKKNLSDANRMARIRKMPLHDAMRMFPGKTKEQLNAIWAMNPLVSEVVKTLEEKRRRDTDDRDLNDYLYDDTCEVTIVHLQWKERETAYIVADPASGQQITLSGDEYERLKKRMSLFGMNLTAARTERNVYKQAWLGDEVLGVDDAPIPGQFSWKCITGEWDDDSRTWFGLVKILRDPQMWANKWLSQILHILNTTAKGGILAEIDAFDDPVEAEQGYARPDSITWMAKDALSGKKPKVMPKPGQGQMTDAYLGLLTFAISSFKDVSGINLELLGQQDQNQPGVLEAMRKQAGMTVLATMFDSLRRFRKQIGRSRLFYMKTYLADGRMIRITGEDGKRVGIPLLQEAVSGTFDVEIEDAPTSPNQKEANWAIIQPLLVVFKDQIMQQPELLAMILEYSPLPSRIVETFKKIIAQKQNDPAAQQQQQIQQQAAQLSLADLAAEVRKKNAAAAKDESQVPLNQAKVQGEQASSMYEVAMARNLLEDNQFNQMKNMVEMLERQADATRADNERIVAEAKAMRERMGIYADQRSQQLKEQEAADNARNLRVGEMIDVLAATGKNRRDHAAAAKDEVIAAKEARTPIADPNRKPVDPNIRAKQKV